MLCLSDRIYWARFGTLRAGGGNVVNAKKSVALLRPTAKLNGLGWRSLVFLVSFIPWTAGAIDHLCPELSKTVLSSSTTWTSLPEAPEGLPLVKRNLTRFEDGLWFSTLGFDRDLMAYVPSWEMKKRVKDFFEFSLHDLEVNTLKIRLDPYERQLVFPINMTLYYRDYRNTRLARHLGNRPLGLSGEIYFAGELVIHLDKGDQLEAEVDVYLTHFADEKRLWGTLPYGSVLRTQVFSEKGAGPLCDYVHGIIEPVLAGVWSQPEQQSRLLWLAQEHHPELRLTVATGSVSP